MSKLYELTETLNAAWRLIEDQAEDDGSFDSRLKSVLDAVQEEFDAKLEGCCQIVTEFESNIEACEREAKRLRDRAGVLKDRIESLKGYMFDALKATQQTKVKTDLFTVSIRKNPGKVDITDQEVLNGLASMSPNWLLVKRLRLGLLRNFKQPLTRRRWIY